MHICEDRGVGIVIGGILAADDSSPGCPEPDKEPHTTHGER